MPLCLPHRLMEDDVYEGMHVPKGSLVIGNIWAIMRDEQLYPDPHSFKPERWLRSQRDPDVHPFEIVFGFGRRYFRSLSWGFYI